MGQKHVSRRTFLAGTAAVLAGCANGDPMSTKMDQAKPVAAWTNWSGAVSCHPAGIHAPATEEALRGVVSEAARQGSTVRAAGSGHSFVPLCATDGALVSLDEMRGVVSTDSEQKQATVWAGTKLYELGGPLWEAGLAMENMGDIDRQALAGAIATGTHGTGRTLGSISTQVTGLRIVTGSGDVITCSESERADVLKAGQVALGALGIVTQVTLRCEPAYMLHEREWQVPFEEGFEAMESLIAGNRHFEFFWRPQTDVCDMKRLTPTELAPTDIADMRGERIGRSYEIFPSVRDNKFNEIEFAVPEERGPECLLELRALMRTKHGAIRWPLEYRTVAADDIYLSPAYGRPTVTISAHEGAGQPYEAFFRDVEAVFRNHQGRPHWGKIHWHSGAELRALYPEWAAFQRVREELDPKGVFLNPYLRGLLA